MTVKVWDHEQNVIGYIWLDDGLAKASPGAQFLIQPPYAPLREPGPKGRYLTAEDGEDFLWLFPLYYSGSNYRAGIVTDQARDERL